MSHNLSVLLLALLARCGEMSHNLSVLLLALLARCGEMSHSLSVLLLALPARVWRGEPQSVRAVVGPAGKGVER